MFRTARKLPLFRTVALAQLGLLAHRHLSALSPAERRRLVELGRRPHRLTSAERGELRRIASKLEPRAFAESAARTFAPFGGGGRKRR